MRLASFRAGMATTQCKSAHDHALLVQERRIVTPAGI
jgi:hypothetical protein